MALFADRRSAGRILGTRLARRELGDAIVLALAPGGVPVGYEVAKALDAPLDVLLVRKLCVPGHDELVMGAIASGGVRVLVPDVVGSLLVPPASIDAVTARERRELERRERAYRGTRPFPDLHGRTVIVVDDVAVTGASMIAAVRAIHLVGASPIVAAAPVMSQKAHRAVLDVADACEAVSVPEPLTSVESHFDDFTQPTDEEVRELLDAAPCEAAMASGHALEPTGRRT